MGNLFVVVVVKTPYIEMLISLLKRDYRVAVLSRRLAA